MSRTFRRKNLAEFPWYRNPLKGWDHETRTRRFVDAKSMEGKKRLKAFHSDRGHCWLSYKGPSWFARDFAQVPYRMRSKTAIARYLKGQAEDVVLECKPYKPYWL